MLAKIKKNTNKQIFVIVFGCFVWLLTHPVVEMFARELPSLALMRLRNALFNSSKWSQNVESILSENPKKKRWDQSGVSHALPVNYTAKIALAKVAALDSD